MTPRRPHEPPLAERFTAPLRQAIAARVVALFRDRSGAAAPVVRRADGLFGPASAAWRVHGDVTSMMVGGVTALLMQMLHPAVLAGVWDHSRFRTDMQGRLRRTARFIAVTTYGGRTEAEAAIARVRGIHDHVRGTLPDGTPYAANDPALLAWVHVTEAASFLSAWVRYVEPRMPAGEQDRYLAEMARIGAALGADPVPRSRAEARDLVRSMQPQLRCDHRTREVARLVLSPPAADAVARQVQAMAVQASVDLLPDWARRLHGLPGPGLSQPVVRAGTRGLAATLRWALG